VSAGTHIQAAELALTAAEFCRRKGDDAGVAYHLARANVQAQLARAAAVLARPP
jgi:hypothetical protein